MNNERNGWGGGGEREREREQRGRLEIENHFEYGVYVRYGEIKLKIRAYQRNTAYFTFSC